MTILLRLFQRYDHRFLRASKNGWEREATFPIILKLQSTSVGWRFCAYFSNGMSERGVGRGKFGGLGPTHCTSTCNQSVTNNTHLTTILTDGKRIGNFSSKVRHALFLASALWSVYSSTWLQMSRKLSLPLAEFRCLSHNILSHLICIISCYTSASVSLTCKVSD
jgi:hypothetical protein